MARFSPEGRRTIWDMSEAGVPGKRIARSRAKVPCVKSSTPVWPLASIPPKERRPDLVLTATAQRHRPVSRSAPSTDTGLDDTISGVRRGCCIDPLSTAVSLSGGQQIAAVAIYVFVGVLGVAAPILVTIFLGDRLHEVLDGWKAWLSQNNAAVMSVLFLIFGVVLIAQAVGAAKP